VNGEATGSPDRSARTVLIVDDDPLLVSGYTRGFNGAGYRVFTALNARVGLDVAKCERPELLIIDLRLGTYSGVEMIRSLRLQDVSGTMFLISGYLSVAVAVSAIRAGADHVFHKPLSVAEILGCLLEGNAPNDQPETASLARATYEHMMRVLEDCDGNLSEAARRLKVHRQSLQRRLRKPPP
jgi:two-component system response regulator RegA